MFFYKEKLDEKTRIYHILGYKFRVIKKAKPVSAITGAKKDDALISLKCLRNLNLKINTVETLVLGSSHARMSFIEDEKSINMVIDAQDLYYSYKLLEKYVRIIPGLKNIVLYYGIFSPGHELDKSPQAYRMSYYSAYFDIPYKNKADAIFKGITELEEKIIKITPSLKKKLDEIPHDLMNSNKRNINPPALEQKWISRWLDLNKRGTQNFYLKQILEIAQENGCKVLIVISPYAPRIKSQLPLSSELFASLYDICKKYSNVQTYNAFDDDGFTESDFVDLEHMSLSGAEKITHNIKQYLKENR